MLKNILLMLLYLSNFLIADGIFIEHPISYKGDHDIFPIDLDEDGDIDILSVNYQANLVLWFQNDGRQNFNEIVISDSQYRPWNITSADLDNDGDIDIVTSGENENIYIYENDGKQNFQSHVIITSSVKDVNKIYITDIDNDGYLDIIAALYYKITWYKNNGNNTFYEIVISDSVHHPYDVFSIDLDNDSDMDVLAAIFEDDKIIWYENNNQTFTEHVISTTVDGAEAVFAADVNADGNVDVLSASGYGDEIAWYANDGNQNFSKHVISDSAERALDVFASDLDGDGDIDVLSASSYDDKIAWYENYCNKYFIEHVISNSAETPLEVYATDLDNDGDVDVLSASWITKIAWYENDLIKTNFFISSINDVPNDQGRKVRIKWSANPYDKIDCGVTNPVTHYSIWRKHDPNLTIHKTSGTPDGEWDFITEVPAVQDNQYSVIVPTLADSNKVNGQYYSTFFVRAHTADPTIHWETAPDSGYSVDNLSPATVSGLNAELVDDNIQLTWDENSEDDIAYYAVYRDTVNGFGPVSLNESIAVVTTPKYKDENIGNASKYYYRVSAVDYNGNESPLSNEVMVNLTSIEMGMHPLTFQLYQNYPNPFNPSTNIKFSLPEQTNLQLIIFNSNGKLIRKLFQGVLSSGMHSFIWDGKNALNVPVGSGVYYYVVKTRDRSVCKKMLLIR